MRAISMIVLGVVLVPGAFAQKKIADIPVVKTWEQLRAVPPIDLGDGVKIRLGLEADRMPQWSGGLLYCLAEGFTPPTRGLGKMPFGPVYADFSYEKEKPGEGGAKWGSFKLPKGTYLYVRALWIARVGTYHVTITDHRSKVMTRAKIAGTKDFFHPWMPWIHSYLKPVNVCKGIVLPNVGGLSPLMRIKAVKSMKGSLPTLLPGDQKTTLEIKKIDEGFLLSAKTPFTTTHLEFRLLARWWVNGKPFIPKQIDDIPARPLLGILHSTKKLRVKYDFRPKCLGAKPGDKVGLQLMYNEGMWEYCDGTSFDPVGLFDASGLPRLSNRIEFIVPKGREK